MLSLLKLGATGCPMHANPPSKFKRLKVVACEGVFSPPALYIPTLGGVVFTKMTGLFPYVRATLSGNLPLKTCLPLRRLYPYKKLYLPVILVKTASGDPLL